MFSQNLFFAKPVFLSKRFFSAVFVERFLFFLESADFGVGVPDFEVEAEEFEAVFFEQFAAVFADVGRDEYSAGLGFLDVLHLVHVALELLHGVEVGGAALEFNDDESSLGVLGEDVNEAFSEHFFLVEWFEAWFEKRQILHEFVGEFAFASEQPQIGVFGHFVGLDV